MHNYEVVFIVHPDLDEANFQGVIEKVKGWIAGAGGAIAKTDIWGKRRMAYQIRKQREGQYVFIEAQMPAAFSNELDRNLRFLEPVMRFLIIAAE
jgi:small subunit ribosomal protein S6